MGRKKATAEGTGWTQKTLNELRLTPGEHKHPTLAGLLLDVPKPKKNGLPGKAAWRTHFRIAGPKAFHDVTLGPALDPFTSVGLSVEAAEQAFKKEFDRMRADLGDLSTLSAAFRDYMANSTHRSTGGAKSAQTLENYAENYVRYLGDYADRHIAAMSTDEWERIFTVIHAKSMTAARQCYWLVNAIYARAIKHDRLSRNPLSKGDLNKKFANKQTRGRKRSGHISAFAIKKFYEGLFEVPKRGHGVMVVKLLLLTGWRRSAVQRLRWEDVKLKAEVVLLRARQEKTPNFAAPLDKDGKRPLGVTTQPPVGWKGYTTEVSDELAAAGVVGVMPLSYEACAVLRERRNDAKEQGDTSEFVFPGYGASKTPYMRNCQGTLDSACKKAGLPRYLVHDLRRTAVTLMKALFPEHLTAPLVGHVAGSGDSTVVHDGYAIKMLPQLKALAGDYAQALYALAEIYPRDEDVIARLKKAGISEGQSLALLDLTDDDEDE